MKLSLVPILTIMLAGLVFGFVGHDLSLMPRTTDLGNVSYTIFSPQRVTIDGQWGHVISLMAAGSIISLQVTQLILQRKRAKG
ncbi:MAG: hypothetical protein EOP85_14635 [Verrucomicrobiaceae bacterium]|nr:MAG: hypothetical protein EOP85_14635 [Verrucomicrobiaceae bacterium]